MFTKFIRLALAISFILGGARIITLKPKDVVGKVFGTGYIRIEDLHKIKEATDAIAEEADSLILFEDAIKKPGFYICLVRKENGKVYTRRFRVIEPGSDQVEQIGDDIEFVYIKGFEKSEMDDKCFCGIDMINAACAFLEDDKYKLIALADAKDSTQTYIGKLRKDGVLYLRQFQVNTDGNFYKTSPDVLFTTIPFQRIKGCLVPSQIIGNCFEGINIEAGKRAIMENTNTVPYKDVTKHGAFYICAIQDKLDNFYLISFTKENGVFKPSGLKYPLDWQLSTLDPSKIVRGCFKGTDIEQAKLAIREDNGLIPFEAIEDNVFYTCATKDDVDNFYLTSFVRKSGRFIQIGAKILLDWKFLYKISEMTSDLAWPFHPQNTCLKVDTNDLETAINEYVKAIAVGEGLIPVTDRLRDGTYVIRNELSAMIFKRAGGRTIRIQGVEIFNAINHNPVQFYQSVRDCMTSDDDKARLDQLVQTPGQRMLVEERTMVNDFRNHFMGNNLNYTDVLNLDLISTANGGLIDVCYHSLDPSNVVVRLNPYSTIRPLSKTRLQRLRFASFDYLDRYLTVKQEYEYISNYRAIPQPYVIQIFEYAQQNFISTLSAILYIDDKNQVFFYYDPAYLLRKHTRSEIDDSNRRLMAILRPRPY